jgi:hypothetical protein
MSVVEGGTVLQVANYNGNALGMEPGPVTGATYVALT